LTAAHLFQPKNGQLVTEIRVLTADGVVFDTQNLSIALGNDTWSNSGPGSQALVQGYDPPQLPGFNVPDPSQDIAVLGISKNIGGQLGVLVPAVSNAKAGSLTLLGFQENGDLVEITARAQNLNGAWIGFFDAQKGTSGGPLLSKDNHVVGIQSDTGFLGLSAADQIDNVELQSIQNWTVHNDFLL
jgi:hypothetical protein